MCGGTWYSEVLVIYGRSNRSFHRIRSIRNCENNPPDSWSCRISPVASRRRRQQLWWWLRKQLRRRLRWRRLSLPPAQVILRFLHRAEYRTDAFDLSPPQSYDLFIRIKIRYSVAALFVAASYLAFAQYFLPYPSLDTRSRLVQRDNSDN